MRTFLLASCLFLSCSWTDLAHAGDSPARADDHGAALDAYIEKAMADWKLPGLAIAVVKDGQTVYVKGFGVRELGRPERVDAHTRFGMMSTTKAMTALAVAMLVDEGKLAWDEPVQKVLPWFEMPDPAFSRTVTVRDTLRHNAGIGPEADLLWLRGDLDSRQILERVRELTPAYPPYSSFSYANVMYQLAGELVTKASGMPWNRFVETRIMAPLGMDESSATYAGMKNSGSENVSAPHFEIDGKLVRVRDGSVDGVPAAGAAWSSAHDMALWLAFLLDDGQAGGKRLVSEKNFHELFRPQALVPDEQFYPTAQLTRPHWISYGLGWFEQDYRGHFVAMHTGSIDGRTSIIGLMPDANLGVYVFGNADHVELRHALMWKVMDLYTGAPDRDWSAELLKLYGESKAKRKTLEAAADARRVKGTRPSHALADYAGTYSNPAFGDVEVTLGKRILSMHFGPLPENAGPLSHWQYDTFRWHSGDGRGGETAVQFGQAGDGSIASVTLGGDDGSVHFVRKAPPAKSE
ncbi:serine hydrolase [Dokdonella immobilis]|uniref:CubicO group peptidase, beta-lactamase class C family n=1 Tax=Dokdonella immobilis TaxID=578942 RepID=A0A1I4ZET9_9GAMM|nr:serine hydrolase [Dokdonella immobilis]SFN48786.1 CubicO group peptidase, beta-lactamase class C family [Dokdonella immobilis]